MLFVKRVGRPDAPECRHQPALVVNEHGANTASHVRQADDSELRLQNAKVGRKRDCGLPPGCLQGRAELVHLLSAVPPCPAPRLQGAASVLDRFSSSTSVSFPDTCSMIIFRYNPLKKMSKLGRSLEEGIGIFVASWPMPALFWHARAQPPAKPAARMMGRLDTDGHPLTRQDFALKGTSLRLGTDSQTLEAAGRARGWGGHSSSYFVTSRRRMLLVPSFLVAEH